MEKSTGDAGLGERARLWFWMYQVSGVDIRMEMAGKQLNMSTFREEVQTGGRNLTTGYGL